MSLVVALSASCGGKSAETKSTTLIVDASFVVKSLDPAQVNEATGNMIVHSLYDSLLTFKGSDVSTPIPSLAKSFKASPDGKDYTFVLRDDAKFSDGTPVSADDVLFSFQRMQNLKGPGSFIAAGLTMRKAAADTVVVHSDVPKPDVPVIMAMDTTAVINAKVVRANGGTDAVDAASKDTATDYLNEHSAGSGPYALDSFNASSQVVLTRNVKYWGTAPHFPRVVIRNMDVQAQKLSMSRATGDEIAMDIAGKLLEDLPDTVQKSGVQDTQYLMVVNSDPAVSKVASNPAFLKALKTSIDYSGVAALFGPGAGPTAGLVPAAYKGALPASGAPTQNIEHAKQILAQAGLDHPSISLSYPAITRRGVDLGTIVTKVAGDAAKAGITIKLVPMPLSAFLTASRGGKQEAFFTPNTMNYPSAVALVDQFEPGKATAMRSAWTAERANPAVELAVDAVRAATSEEAQTAALQAWQRAMNKFAPFFALAIGSSFVVGSASLTGVSYSPAGWQLDLAAVGGED